MRNAAIQFDGYPQVPIHNRPAVEARVDASKLSKMIYKSAFQAMDGPLGVNPADLIAALGAIAGYSARWVILRQIADGQLEDDFVVSKGCNMPFISVSKNVNTMITDLTRDSFAGVLVNAMISAGASWLPNKITDVDHNFFGINNPTFPTYTVEEHYRPQVPPQASLLMMWESQARILAHTTGAEDVAMQAYAMATTHVAKEFENELPMDCAAQIALETAIAMSKLKYAF